LMFLNIQIDLIILKTFNQQFTLTTKKSLHIIFKVSRTLIVVENSQNLAIQVQLSFRTEFLEQTAYVCGLPKIYCSLYQYKPFLQKVL